MTHTPTPWIVEDRDTLGGHNASCCVAHAALVAALRNALNVLAGIATGDLDTIKTNSPAIAQARAALALAETGRAVRL